MGWWRVTDIATGQISDKKPSGHPGGDLLNAFPGRDDPNDMYGGDAPADAMGAAIDKADAAFKSAWGRHARPDEMQACFNFCFNGWRKRVHEPPSKSPATGEPAVEPAPPAEEVEARASADHEAQSGQ